MRQTTGTAKGHGERSSIRLNGAVPAVRSPDSMREAETFHSKRSRIVAGMACVGRPLARAVRLPEGYASMIPRGVGHLSRLLMSKP